MPTTTIQPLDIAPSNARVHDTSLPPSARPTSGMNPLHSKTESTLAPTSEFTRLFLLGWVVRYIFRGGSKEIFDSGAFGVIRRPVARFIESRAAKETGRINKILSSADKEIAHLRPAFERATGDLERVASWFRGIFHAEKGLTETQWNAAQSLKKKLSPVLRKWRGDEKEFAQILKESIAANRQSIPDAGLFNPISKAMGNMAYSLSLGVGSGILSLTYSAMVRRDIRNMFSEVVAYEKGISPDQVTFSDIATSNNRIIKRTVHNYRVKLAQRLGTDALFFAATPLKSEGITDGLLGLKGIQIFAETWKRTPTLFEDIVTLVNNKINPRNGLGQAVTVGEVFDLYQHYTEQFTPAKMFRNVLERGSGEGAVWAESQPIFQRITELMNLTYAYKHPTMLDAAGQTLAQANFPLPKLIYLLGHDLIDPREPARTLIYIEVANRYGMEEVRAMQQSLAAGASLNDIWAKYPAARPMARTAEAPVATPINSITQVNHPEKSPQLTTPHTTVDAASSEHHSAREKLAFVPSL
jgi:hypothetical protein